MLLLFPSRRISTAMILSVFLHGVLLWVLSNYAARRDFPVQVQWFELAEMNFPESTNAQLRTRPQRKPDDAVRPSRSGELKEKDPGKQKTDATIAFRENAPSNAASRTTESVIVIYEDAAGEERPVPVPIKPHSKNELSSPKTGQVTAAEVGKTTPSNLSSVLRDARRFRPSSKWNVKPQDPPPISSSLESLLNRMNMIPLNRVSRVNPVRLRLDEAAARNYRKRLNAFFSKHWEVPMNLANSPLTVVALIRMKRDGQLVSYVIEQKSGNDEFDRSIEELLKNLQFLPSLPDSYLEHAYEMGFRFTPLDFQF